MRLRTWLSKSTLSTSDTSSSLWNTSTHIQTFSRFESKSYHLYASKIFVMEAETLPLRVDGIVHDLRKSCTVELSFQDTKIVVWVAYEPQLSFGIDTTANIEYLKQLDAAEESRDFQKLYSVQLELGNFVKDICAKSLPDLRQIPCKECMLDKVLNPEILSFQLVVTIDGSKLIRSIEDTPAYPHLSIVDKTHYNVTVPTFNQSQIEVLDKLVSNRIMRVRVKQEILCCKLASPGFQGISREIQVLDQINRVHLCSSSRVPRLKGLIGSTEGVIGFVMDYIETSLQYPHLGSLENYVTDVARGRREKWANQINSTLDDLHRNSLVWGDAKPSNILLDKDDNAWLIDFGGSRTEGWVDAAYQESVQGDRHASTRICSFLNV